MTMFFILITVKILEMLLLLSLVTTMILMATMRKYQFKVRLQKLGSAETSIDIYTLVHSLPIDQSYT